MSQANYMNGNAISSQSAMLTGNARSTPWAPNG